MSYKIQLKKGKATEREHRRTYEKMISYHKKTGKCFPKDKFYESIAKDHLSEFPHKNYYTELDKMEKKLK
jgi:hypothetical protein